MTDTAHKCCIDNNNSSSIGRRITIVVIDIPITRVIGIRIIIWLMEWIMMMATRKNNDVRSIKSKYKNDTKNIVIERMIIMITTIVLALPGVSVVDSRKRDSPWCKQTLTSTITVRKGMKHLVLVYGRKRLKRETKLALIANRFWKNKWNK